MNWIKKKSSNNNGIINDYEKKTIKKRKIIIKILELKLNEVVIIKMVNICYLWLWIYDIDYM